MYSPNFDGVHQEVECWYPLYMIQACFLTIAGRPSQILSHKKCGQMATEFRWGKGGRELGTKIWSKFDQWVAEIHLSGIFAGS